MISVSHWGMFEDELRITVRVINQQHPGQWNDISAATPFSPPTGAAQAALNAYYQHNRFGTLD